MALNNPGVAFLVPPTTSYTTSTSWVQIASMTMISLEAGTSFYGAVLCSHLYSTNTLQFRVKVNGTVVQTKTIANITLSYLWANTDGAFTVALGDTVTFEICDSGASGSASFYIAGLTASAGYTNPYFE